MTSGDGVMLSNGSATLVARGRSVFLRVFAATKRGASRLRERSGRACRRPSRRRWSRALWRDRVDCNAVRQHTTMFRNDGRLANLSAICGPDIRRNACGRRLSGVGGNNHNSRRDEMVMTRRGRAGDCCAQCVCTGGVRTPWPCNGVLRVSWPCRKLSRPMRPYGRWLRAPRSSRRCLFRPWPCGRCSPRPRPRRRYSRAPRPCRRCLPASYPCTRCLHAF